MSGWLISIGHTAWGNLFKDRLEKLAILSNTHARSTRSIDISYPHLCGIKASMLPLHWPVLRLQWPLIRSRSGDIDLRLLRLHRHCKLIGSSGISPKTYWPFPSGSADLHFSIAYMNQLSRNVLRNTQVWLTELRGNCPLLCWFCHHRHLLKRDSLKGRIYHVTKKWNNRGSVSWTAFSMVEIHWEQWGGVWKWDRGGSQYPVFLYKSRKVTLVKYLTFLILSSSLCSRA